MLAKLSGKWKKASEIRLFAEFPLAVTDEISCSSYGLVACELTELWLCELFDENPENNREKDIRHGHMLRNDFTWCMF